MRKHTAGRGGKGWFSGPWDSAIPVALGFSDRAVNESHVHDQMYEVYLVARGKCSAVVDGHSVPLCAGDVLVVEPGEEHTFTTSSDDYLHFVVQAPFVSGDKRTQ